MSFDSFRKKMVAENVSEAAIKSFQGCYEQLVRNETGLIPEADIQPVESLPKLAEIATTLTPRPELLEQCAVLKLNGGLGTGMGLEKAKSLLEVRPGVSFLDLIVQQILHFRRTSGSNLRFLLMNSFSTSADTRAALAAHPEIGSANSIELLQNKVPKVDAATLAPAEWPTHPDHEWCPPGHGDLYAVLAGSGALKRLIAEGVNYLFVSNSDNLGATLDLSLLTWFADSHAPFAMEVTARTPSDRKGGHLAKQDGHLILRESAQCPDADMDTFQDITLHRFFNTNNLWLRLDRLQEAIEASGGFLPLPLIRNSKTVDPRDKKSPKVFQLEIAMGAAIASFPDAVAIDVPRSRFAPVKTTADLLALRSDAYELTEEGSVLLAESRAGIPPKIDLDDNYKLVDQLEASLTEGAPSLKNCVSLKVKGPVAFSSEIIFEGSVEISNESEARLGIPRGTHKNSEIKL